VDTWILYFITIHVLVCGAKFHSYSLLITNCCPELIKIHQGP